MGLLDWLFVWRGETRRQGRSVKSGRGGGASAAGRAVGERRAVPRFAGLGARVIIDKTEYDVVDWAENSFRIVDYDGDLIANQIVHFRFLLVYREETWEWPGIGRVVRVDTKTGDLAVVFKPPEEPFRSRLRNVTDALMQGDQLARLTGSRKDNK